MVSPELKELSAQVSEPKFSNPASETKLEQSKHTIPAQKGCFQVENLGVNCMSFNILKLEKICKKMYKQAVEKDAADLRIFGK